MRKFVSKSIEDTKNIANEWVASILHYNISQNIEDIDDSATVVGLSGHLGAGKTAFVKCIAKLFGINENITSPTYVIMKIYDIDRKIAEKNFGKDFPWNRLVHIDAYRLEKTEDLQALDWENLVSDNNNLVLVEWPENVGIKESNQNSSISFDTEEDVHIIEY